MSFNARELRAIKYWCRVNNAVPQLTTYPQVRVKVRSTGEEITDDVRDVLASYDDARREEARERARSRRGAVR